MQETKWTATDHRLARAEMETDDTDDVVTGIKDGEYDEDKGYETTWLSPMSPPTLDALRWEIQQAASPDTIMASQGTTHVRARQLQTVFDGGKKRE